MQANNKVVSGLTLIALVAMIAAYFAPIWWVSLTAPNYPPDAFPDGIRIHFHFDGVYNGCKAARKGSRQAQEVVEKDLDHTVERWNPVLDPKKQQLDMKAEGLDCVHEMNTINHYVGMFPIATGAPVEKPLAKFFFGFFAVMLAAFACVRPKVRMAILTVGFAAVAAWTVVDQFVLGHLATHVKEYMAETATFFNYIQRKTNMSKHSETFLLQDEKQRERLQALAELPHERSDHGRIDAAAEQHPQGHVAGEPLAGGLLQQLGETPHVAVDDGLLGERGPAIGHVPIGADLRPGGGSPAQAGGGRQAVHALDNRLVAQHVAQGQVARHGLRVEPRGHEPAGEHRREL